MSQALMMKNVQLSGSMKTYNPSGTNTKKRCPFHHSGLERKSWCLKDPLFDCGDGFTGIPTFQNLSNCILNMCILFPSILPQ